MKSVILAGGFGTRIRPLTLSKPKPLVEFCNRPAIEYQFEACKNAGVNHIILAVSEFQNITEEVKKLGEKYSIRIDFSVESTPLGTAGSIRLAKDLICETDDDSDEFITFNSDIICDYPLTELLESHRKNKAKVTILVTDVDDPKEFGVILYDEDNKIKSFIEKPKDLISNKINAGVYILSKEVLDQIPLKNYSIEKEFFPKFLKFGTTYAHHLNGFWSDIGKPNGYLNAQNLYLTNLNHLHNTNKKRHIEDVENKPKLSKDTSLEMLDCRGTLYSSCLETPMSSLDSLYSESQPDLPESKFKGPVLIHPSCDIGYDCLIGPNVCVGPNVKIGNGCRIANSTLMEEGSIIGWQSYIKRWTRIEGLTVLGKSVVVGESLFLRGSIVLPHKNISSSLYDSGQEIVLFKKDPPPNCKLEVFGKKNNIWIVTWTGLPGTLYNGETYKLKIILPDGYPLKPPIIYFLNPAPVHPHVYSNGDICMSSIRSDYLPSASISSFVLSIISMLSSAKEKRLPLDNNLHLNEINLNNITTIPSLEYLGCGYNLLFNKKNKIINTNKKQKKENNNDTTTNSSNTDSNISNKNDKDKELDEKEEKEIDTNYKNPVIKFNWSGDIKNLNNTLEYLHPEGTYIYNFPNCSITQENKTENLMNKLENLINSEISLDVINLNADSNSKKLKANSKFKNNLEKVIYCSIFIAGINSFNQMEYNDQFISTILNLKHLLKIEKRKGCIIKRYKKSICSNVRQAWTNFFNSYGTHYITKIVLGGKIEYNEENNNNADINNKSNDLNLNSKILNINKSNKDNKSLNESTSKSNVNMYGGINFNNNQTWFSELKKNPVPIKLILTSFKSILTKYNIYNEYINFLKLY